MKRERESAGMKERHRMGNSGREEEREREREREGERESACMRVCSSSHFSLSVPEVD